MSETETKRRIVETSRAILAGSIGVVEGSRALRSMFLSLSADVTDRESVQLFILIESETDGEPVGDTRRLWNAGALEERDRKLREYLVQMKPHVERACRQLIEEFS